MRVHFTTIFAIIAIMYCDAGVARAEPVASPLTLCNRMPGTLGVAVGFFSSGVNDTEHALTGPFVSRGWRLVASGQCQTFDNPFSARYMFWFAFGRGLNDDALEYMANFKESLKSPAMHFCVTDYFRAAGGPLPDFNFEDENVDVQACFSDRKRNPTMWVTTHKVDTVIQPQVDVTGP